MHFFGCGDFNVFIMGLFCSCQFPTCQPSLIGNVQFILVLFLHVQIRFLGSKIFYDGKSGGGGELSVELENGNEKYNFTFCEVLFCWEVAMWIDVLHSHPREMIGESPPSPSSSPSCDGCFTRCDTWGLLNLL